MEPMMIEDTTMEQLLVFLHAYKGNRMTDKQTAYEILQYFFGAQDAEDQSQ